MKTLTQEQKNDELVKSLLESGFAEDVIAGWLDEGAISLTKSEKLDDGDTEEVEDTEDVQKSCGSDKKKAVHDGDDADDDNADEDEEVEETEEVDVAKSIREELAKSLTAQHDELIKSIGDAVDAAVNDKFAEIEKSIDGIKEMVKNIGASTPDFKSAGLSRTVIEKSISGTKDEHEKTILSVSRDRMVVRSLIEKSIEEEPDADIQKSLRENTQAYLIDPICGAIGEMAARYMYDNKNVRLVK